MFACKICAERYAVRYGSVKQHQGIEDAVDIRELSKSGIQAYQQSHGQAAANRASVKLELQADCLAGVWANHTEEMEQSRAKEFLENGDIDEALRAASMIGDDRLQMQSRGYVVPESFTHGTAAQRSYWFRQGFENGTVSACNTFGADNTN